MMKDPTEFRQRFDTYKKEGIKAVYDAGKPIKDDYSVGSLVDAIYANNPVEEFLGEPEHHYDFTLSEQWANEHGYYPDKRGHRDDRVKKIAHPSHPSRGVWNGDKYELTDFGMETPNYTLFGLNDGNQDSLAILTYKNGIVIPEITVTPNENYIYNPYDNIKMHLPKYDDGKDGEYFEEDGYTWHYVNQNGKKLKRKVFFKSNNGDVFRTRQEALDNNPTPFKKALFNRIDPTQDYPTPFVAARHWVQSQIKALKGEENKKEWDLDNTVGNNTSVAAWAKYLGMPYDRSLLPAWNGDTVSLSKPLEAEIPIDTTMLKDRISNTERLMRMSSKYKNSNVIKAAYNADKLALEALRKTYATGLPVGINEFAYNSRQLVDNGIIDEWNISPLNVLKEYNIRYDKDKNQMFYSDGYDFNEFDWAIPGKSFRIRGAIDLPKQDKGKSIHIKPANRGKFTATKKRTGKTTEQLAHSKNPLTRKRAVFALNARKWHH